MDQLVQTIKERTGISEDQARQAIQMTIDFVKTKLPPPVASQVDSVLGENGSNLDQMSGHAQNAFGAINNFFGKKD